MADTLSVLAELADGVAARLNDTAFSIAFQAHRAWAPLIDRGELDKPTVSVCPDSKTLANVSRSPVRLNTVTIDVGIRRMVGATPAPAEDRVDVLGNLAQEVEDELMNFGKPIVTANLKATPVNAVQYFVREDLIVEQVVSFYVVMTYSLFR